MRESQIKNISIVISDLISVFLVLYEGGAHDTYGNNNKRTDCYFVIFIRVYDRRPCQLFSSDRCIFPDRSITSNGYTDTRY